MKITFAVLLCCALLSFVPLWATDGDVEEGWRYHASLQLNIKVDGASSDLIDLLPMHNSMAEVLLPHVEKNVYCSIFRFMPIVAVEDKITLGKDVRLTDAVFEDAPYGLFLPNYEAIFLSGFCKPEKSNELFIHMKSISLKREGKQEKRDTFCIQPPFSKKEPMGFLAVKLLQRINIDPELFGTNKF